MRSSACTRSLSTEGRSRRLIGVGRPAGGFAPAEEPFHAAEARGEEESDGEIEDAALEEPRDGRAVEAEPDGLAEEDAGGNAVGPAPKAAIEVAHEGHRGAGEGHEPEAEEEPEREHAPARVYVEDERGEAAPAKEREEPRGEGEAEGVIGGVHAGDYIAGGRGSKGAGRVNGWNG